MRAFPHFSIVLIPHQQQTSHSMPESMPVLFTEIPFVSLTQRHKERKDY